MINNPSIEFFDRQFKEQSAGLTLKLNPFEERVLPYLHGKVLDYGCGMGNLAFAAASQGCSVTALDASTAAISHIQTRAKAETLPVSAELADLRDYKILIEFDCVVSIGLLMFFDCPTAFRVLQQLQKQVRPSGIAAVNVLIEGTTYMDMFDPSAYCLFPPMELEDQFKGWKILQTSTQNFNAPNDSLKCFSTVVAQKP